jgi:glyoxalase superfamily protein
MLPVVTSAPARFKDLCLDATDHQALADWWCRVMGYRRWGGHGDRPPRPREHPVLIVDPTGAGPAIWIAAVPEPKVVKNRMHVDVVGHTDALLAAGATLVRRRGGDIEWDVLADPEGNEFCCFAPDPPAGQG